MVGRVFQVTAGVVCTMAIDRAHWVISVASTAPFPASLFAVAGNSNFVAGRCL